MVHQANEQKHTLIKSGACACFIVASGLLLVSIITTPPAGYGAVNSAGEAGAPANVSKSDGR